VPGKKLVQSIRIPAVGIKSAKILDRPMLESIECLREPEEIVARRS